MTTIENGVIRGGVIFPWKRMLLTSALILISITCLAVAGSLVYLWAERTGSLSTWSSLGSPPEQAVELVSADLDIVFVKTEQGDIFGCNHETSQSSETCWVQSLEPLDIDPEAEFDRPLFDGTVKPPRGEVVDELVATMWYADAAFETRYVLLADNQVLKWEYDVSSNWSFFICFLGPVAGLVLGIGLVILIWLIIGLRWLNTKSK